MKFAKLSLVAVAASVALSSAAFAADAPKTYTADNVKQICSTKKDPKACAARRKVGAPISAHDMKTMNKAAK